jgi:uridine kinase
MHRLDDVVALILGVRARTPAARAVLVALSGIDGAGKGYVSEQIAKQVAQTGNRIASINVDGWLEPPDRRFSKDHPAEHYYEHGIRFDAMFEQLVLPLRNCRSVHLEAQLADATNTGTLRSHAYEFEDIDIVLLEGIFLLKRTLRSYYDLSLWVDCSFDTALRRAVGRAQEGLSEEETVRAYELIYFAAQRLHLARDDPRAAADLIIDNDR